MYVIVFHMFFLSVAYYMQCSTETSMGNLYKDIIINKYKDPFISF